MLNQYSGPCIHQDLDFCAQAIFNADVRLKYKSEFISIGDLYKRLDGPFEMIELTDSYACRLIDYDFHEAVAALYNHFKMSSGKDITRDFDFEIKSFMDALDKSKRLLEPFRTTAANTMGVSIGSNSVLDEIESTQRLLDSLHRVFVKDDQNHLRQANRRRFILQLCAFLRHLKVKISRESFVSATLQIIQAIGLAVSQDALDRLIDRDTELQEAIRTLS